MERERGEQGRDMESTELDGGSTVEPIVEKQIEANANQPKDDDIEDRTPGNDPDTPQNETTQNQTQKKTRYKIKKDFQH